jgi:dTDP-4-dehydrorhamnose 3,5-epimerase
MKTTLHPTPLEGVLVVDIAYFEDDRGFLIETWNQKHFREAGLDVSFIQANHSRSLRNVVRGIHYQDTTAAAGKMVRCTLGSILDVAVDLRVSSPTFGQWYGIELTGENKKQLWVPEGFGHGFATLSAVAEVQYFQTGLYTPSSEGGIMWNDPDVGIEWPIESPILSKRDQEHPSLADYRMNPAFG